MATTTISPRPLPRVVLARDVSKRALRAALAARSVEPIRPGAYLPTVEDETGWQQRERRALGRIAAVARQLPSAVVVSHSSAALVHGLWVPNIEDEVHVTQRQKAPGRRSPGVCRHNDALSDDDVIVVNGVRVTTIERTITDCARTLHPRDGLVVVDSGMRAVLRPSRFDREAVEEGLREFRARLRTRVDEGPPRGRRQARAVLEHADPFAESAPESILRWIAVAHGLPQPVLQMPIVTRRGTYYADLAWEVTVREPDGTVVVWLVLLEYDGAIKYAGNRIDARAASDVVVAEKRREDAIREQRRTAIRRFEWADLGDVEQAFARICGAFPAGGLPLLCPVPELLGKPA